MTTEKESAARTNQPHKEIEVSRTGCMQDTNVLAVEDAHKGLALVMPGSLSLQRGGDMRNWTDSVGLLLLSSVMSVY